MARLVPLAMGAGLILFSIKLAGLAFGLLQHGNFRTEGSPAGGIMAVFAYAAPVGALIALALGAGLIRRGLRG